MHKYSVIGKLLTDRSGDKAEALYFERVMAAHELSTAFSFLHERRLVYRDIKPENIGFDIVSFMCDAN